MRNSEIKPPVPIPKFQQLFTHSQSRFISIPRANCLIFLGLNLFFSERMCCKARTLSDYWCPGR